MSENEPAKPLGEAEARQWIDRRLVEGAEPEQVAEELIQLGVASRLAHILCYQRDYETQLGKGAGRQPTLRSVIRLVLVAALGGCVFYWARTEYVEMTRTVERESERSVAAVGVAERHRLEAMAHEQRAAAAFKKLEESQAAVQAVMKQMREFRRDVAQAQKRKDEAKEALKEALAEVRASAETMADAERRMREVQAENKRLKVELAVLRERLEALEKHAGVPPARSPERQRRGHTIARGNAPGSPRRRHLEP